MPVAVLFDLDGVISDTASVHARAWKAVFDRVLSNVGQASIPFDESADYLRYVDGKTRLIGIADFLRSRGIDLPEGAVDATGIDTMQGIGNTKNAVFRELLERCGVSIFDDASRAIHALTDNGMELGLASSSKNARLVLEKAGLEEKFKSILDGMVAEQQRVPSKPDPAFYRCAAALVGRHPNQCIVLEDAISGVVSAKLAGAGLVIGVCRNGDKETLAANGADIVVASLDELDFRSNQSGFERLDLMLKSN